MLLWSLMYMSNFNFVFIRKHMFFVSVIFEQFHFLKENKIFSNVCWHKYNVLLNDLQNFLFISISSLISILFLLSAAYFRCTFHQANHQYNQMYNIHCLNHIISIYSFLSSWVYSLLHIFQHDNLQVTQHL